MIRYLSMAEVGTGKEYILRPGKRLQTVYSASLFLRSGTVEIAQSINCSLCKYEGQSWVPSTRSKGQCGVGHLQHRTGEPGIEDPRGLVNKLAWPSQWVPGVFERCCPKKQHKWLPRHSMKADLWPPYAWAHRYTCTRIHTDGKGRRKAIHFSP